MNLLATADWLKWCSSVFMNIHKHINLKHLFQNTRLWWQNSNKTDIYIQDHRDLYLLQMCTNSAENPFICTGAQWSYNSLSLPTWMTAKRTLPDPKVNMGPNTTEEPKRTFHFLSIHRWFLNKCVYELHYVCVWSNQSQYYTHVFMNLRWNFFVNFIQIFNKRSKNNYRISSITSFFGGANETNNNV